SSLFLITLFTLTIVPAFSQSFEVPKDYELKSAADYPRYEKDIIEAAKWLKETPLYEQEEKHQKVFAFVLQWVNGSPSVNVEINPTIMDFEKKNKGMLILYMATSARYVLENNYSKDMRAKHKFALHEMIAVYKANKDIKRDKKMEKLIKSDEEGKLDEWLSENLKIGSN
ncbi:MAG TPA: hypothetical protein VF008_25155, partial [Niastella sp.]